MSNLRLFGGGDRPPNKLHRTRTRYMWISMPHIHEIATMWELGGEEFAAEFALKLTYFGVITPDWLMEDEVISFEIGREANTNTIMETPTYLLTVHTRMTENDDNS